MNKDVENIIADLNGFSAALEFIGDAIESHDSDGVDINACGLAYLVKMLGRKSSKVSEVCWELERKKSVSSRGSGT